MALPNRIARRLADYFERGFGLGTGGFLFDCRGWILGVTGILDTRHVKKSPSGKEGNPDGVK